MNSRIKELAKEAGINFGGHPMNPLSVYPSQLEKFAHLVVRECIVDFYRRYLDLTSRDDITTQIDNYVKEQFGGSSE